MREDLSRDEVVGVIDRMLEELLEKAGLQEPPVDALALAQRHLGLTVSLDRRPPQRGRVRRQLELRPEPTAERQQWTAAHATPAAAGRGRAVAGAGGQKRAGRA